jgi:hypothetical protein
MRVSRQQDRGSAAPNFTTHARSRVANVVRVVVCRLLGTAGVVERRGRALRAKVNGVSALCNQTTCCCPTGSFQLSNVNANSMHLKTGLAGQCNNKTSFDADVALNQLAHTFLEVKQGAWPFSGNYLHITTSMMGMLNADKGCAFLCHHRWRHQWWWHCCDCSLSSLSCCWVVFHSVLWRRRRGASTYQNHLNLSSFFSLHKSYVIVMIQDC